MIDGAVVGKKGKEVGAFDGRTLEGIYEGNFETYLEGPIEGDFVGAFEGDLVGDRDGTFDDACSFRRRFEFFVVAIAVFHVWFKYSGIYTVADSPRLTEKLKVPSTAAVVSCSAPA